MFTSLSFKLYGEFYALFILDILFGIGAKFMSYELVNFTFLLCRICFLRVSYYAFFIAIK